MKKLLVAVLSLCLASSVYAACYGPFCYDDRYATVSMAVGIQGITAATFPTINPPATGLLYYCTDCTSTLLVISTGTTKGAFAAVSVSTSATSGMGGLR